ncbi:MAG: three-Cys-motif partner protein TcmP [Rhodocyclaceae bacterium]|nr:three-Cys-motif partner protein TcmP [Rhodocyclaceae bacterium]
MIATDFAPVAPRCQLVPGDANDALKNWCAARDWENERAVVFLDPYEMQVRWDTIETLAATKAVDLLYLFPLGIGVVRLLRRDGELDPAWQRRLDVLFGTPDWQDRFFQVKTVTDLFGDRETLERDASIENIEAYVQERLKSCFAGVAKGLILRNTQSSPLYLLCFASANQKGSATAVKIAQSILAD